MGKLIIFCITVLLSLVALPTKAERHSIMELPPYERAVLIIKKYETLHKLSDRPYYGYGHRIQPGERLPQNRPLNEREADSLLRSDLNKMLSYFNGFRKSDALLLAVLSYNIGPCAVQKSSVYKMLKNGNRNIFKAYTNYCHYRGKFHKQIFQRRCVEYIALFFK